MTVTIAAGLAIRFAPLGLPPFVVKYGGSVLWALMVYWIVSALLSEWRLLSVALITCGLTTMVECLKLYHSAPMDNFRLTLPGMLLLGRFFSVWDIVAYGLGIALGAFLDERIRRIKDLHD